MSSEANIWIGQDGQRYGPYTEANLRQWIGEGRFGPGTLAWREGMAAWAPLAQLFPDATAVAPPPFSAPPPPPKTFSDGDVSGTATTREQRRSELPSPPSLHWGLVLLFAILTLGLFGVIWPFVQSSWVRKIDRHSHATLLLGLALGCFVTGYALIIAAAPARGGSAGLPALGLVLLLAYWVLYLVAYFSMAGSLENRFRRGTPTVHIGGVTLFFFNMYYLQGQLRWLARWKETGRVDTSPPKGVFYLLWLFPGVIAILAAIALPAYQDYVLRAQVAEGFAVARDAETAVAAYYADHGDMPQDNAAAGIDETASINRRYVSSIDVEAGKLVIAYDAPQANRALRGRVLVLVPYRDARGQVQWNCNTPDTTIQPQYLPLACRG